MQNVRQLYIDKMCEQFLLGYFSVIFLLSNVSQVDGFSKMILEKFFKQQNIQLLLQLLYKLHGMPRIKVLQIIESLLKMGMPIDLFDS